LRLISFVFVSGQLESMPTLGIGLPALDVASAFPQATAASIFPEAGTSYTLNPAVSVPVGRVTSSSKNSVYRFPPFFCHLRFHLEICKSMSLFMPTMSNRIEYFRHERINSVRLFWAGRSVIARGYRTSKACSWCNGETCCTCYD
jgi:hypothetical protein